MIARTSSPLLHGRRGRFLRDMNHDEALQALLRQLSFGAHEADGMDIGALLGSTAQYSFQSGVEIAPHLRHSLVAILAKVRRWLIIFEDSPALLVLKQNHPQRRVESGRELMAGHL